jgi:hypothetical protein
MSGSLRLNGSTSGFSEITAPDVAGDQTFTLPAVGGELVTSDNVVSPSNVGIATAWVNFAGTTLGIRDSYNINTITRVSDGKYKVYFTTPMDNADYCAQICSIANGQFIDNQETDYIGISTTNSSGVRADGTITNVVIFGGKS